MGEELSMLGYICTAIFILIHNKRDLYEFPRAAVKNCHKLGSLKQQKFILS